MLKMFANISIFITDNIINLFNCFGLNEGIDNLPFSNECDESTFSPCLLGFIIFYTEGIIMEGIVPISLIDFILVFPIVRNFTTTNFFWNTILIGVLFHFVVTLCTGAIMVIIMWNLSNYNTELGKYGFSYWNITVGLILLCIGLINTVILLILKAKLDFKTIYDTKFKNLNPLLWSKKVTLIFILILLTLVFTIITLIVKTIGIYLTTNEESKEVIMLLIYSAIHFMVGDNLIKQ
jgi:hypothetical protein